MPGASAPAPCVPHSPLFFAPSGGETVDARDARVAAARAVCETCDLRAHCLATAIANNEPEGIWGGYTTVERREIARYRRARRVPELV